MQNNIRKVAHDLNNVLTVINGHAELLEIADIQKKDVYRHDILERVNKLKDAIHHGKQLTNLLLCNNGNKDNERINLNELVLDALKTFNSLKADKNGDGVKIRTLLEPQLWPVRVNKVDIERVLLNIGKNAYEAMADTKDRNIYVITRNKIQADMRRSKRHIQKLVQVCIRNSGAGIDPNMLASLFSGSTTKKNGKGLGLISVWDTIVWYGGFIQAESLGAQGAGFEIYLPAAD